MNRVGVDAHCHIFNASDLPAAEFTATVILKLEERLPPGLEHLAKWLTKFAVNQLKNGAPTGKEEIKRLSKGLKSSPSALLELSEIPSEQALLADLKKGIDELLGSEDRDERELGFILRQEMGGLMELDAQQFTKTFPADNVLGAPFLPLARFDGRRGWFAYIKDFLWFLRCHRYSNGQKMFALYGGANRVNLIAPALIDYEFWLRKAKNAQDSMDTTTPLEDQLEVMQMVNRVSKGVIHAYAPYDPLRDVEQKGRALKVVQDAIHKYGFVGVKMYPPMGFQAWGNDGLEYFIPGEPSKKWRANLGRELDGRLRTFYEWCVQENVPILTHSNSTVLSHSSYYDRPNPKHWGRLLEHSGIPGIENLRVLMGHFGGFGDMQLNPKNENGKRENQRIKEWTDEIVRLCSNFPNIYADLSYHEVVLDDAAQSRYARQLGALVAGSGAGMKRKICYGSDWVMLAKQQENEFYRDRMEEVMRMAGLGKTEVADVMGHNALRFLGLQADGKGRMRLENYYRRRKIDSPFWWNAAASLI